MDLLLDSLINHKATQIQVAAAMRSCGIWLLTLMLVMDSTTCSLLPPANSTRWEVLEATANRVHMDDEILIKSKEAFRYLSWSIYTRESRLNRPEVVNEMSEMLKEIALWDTRLDMIGLILFGPQRSREILHASEDRLPVPGDSWGDNCLSSIYRSLANLCGPISVKSLRHPDSLSNMCMLVEKSAIEDAIAITCGFNITHSSVPQQQMTHGFTAFGTGLPNNAPSSKDILNLDADDYMHVHAVKSYVDSALAMVAFSSCLALCYVVSSKIPPMLSKKPEFPWEKFRDGWTRDLVAECSSSPEFRDWVIKNSKNSHRIV